MREAYESPLFDLYAEVSGKPRGQGTGLLRDVIIAETDEEAMALWEDFGRFSGRAWFEPFGFRRGLMDPVTKNFATREGIDRPRLRASRHRRYRDARARGQHETAAGRLVVLLHLQRAGSAQQVDEVDGGVVDESAAKVHVSHS